MDCLLADSNFPRMMLRNTKFAFRPFTHAFTLWANLSARRLLLSTRRSALLLGEMDELFKQINRPESFDVYAPHPR